MLQRTKRLLIAMAAVLAAVVLAVVLLAPAGLADINSVYTTDSNHGGGASFEVMAPGWYQLTVCDRASDGKGAVAHLRYTTTGTLIATWRDPSHNALCQYADSPLDIPAISPGFSITLTTCLYWHDSNGAYHEKYCFSKVGSS